MLPEDARYGPWAASGEIDILEAVNLGVRCEDCGDGTENRILGTLHFGGAWPDNRHKRAEVALPAPLDGWPVFGLVWRERRLDCTVDGRLYPAQVAGGGAQPGSSGPPGALHPPLPVMLTLPTGGGP